MKVKMQAGKYYIGDPCYIFKDSWMDVLEQTNYFENDVQSVFGFAVAGGGTAHGDGTYYDDHGRSYPVDAGLIAVMPVDLLKKDNVVTEDDVVAGKYGHIITFKDDFTAVCSGGLFKFGDISIDTDDQLEDDDYEDDYDWEQDNY